MRGAAMSGSLSRRALCTCIALFGYRAHMDPHSLDMHIDAAQLRSFVSLLVGRGHGTIGL